VRDLVLFVGAILRRTKKKTGKSVLFATVMVKKFRSKPVSKDNKDNKDNSDNEWSQEQEDEIARLMKEFKLIRIKAIQTMQRTKHAKAERLRLYGEPRAKSDKELQRELQRDEGRRKEKIV
jgi:hypothetical protein